ncbi:unnamed protein product [Mytilus edulis]|uniref:Novel STAND NTPase 3 domain-containing protein n=1 Tax=Mytilus edulis TaxID=6550 RepID=A0A8S3V1J9_MYTED|nr:unnamed protein product [Mytilus edulis]
MDKETATSAGIKLEIPPELQNEIDEIALKRPRKADLDDDQKRWLVVGICLHSVLSPALRKYVDPILSVFHNDLVLYHKIDMQIYPAHLKRDPYTGIFLNYDIVNNNKVNYGKNIAKYDYTIKDAVDLSKLFLQSHIALYTGFDETCDSSALLGLILNIAKFDPVIKADADNVRKYIRNPWAHCDFTEWDAVKFSNSFQLMKKLVKDLKLSTNEEGLIIDEMEKWELNGELEENVSKCACHDSHDVYIERWKEQELMFVETPVVKVISQILESKQNVLIVGEPGIGKRMLLHHIALQLHNKHDYSIIPCSGIPDIRYNFKRDIRQIFVLDDICGRLTISLRDIDYLLKHEDFLKLILQNGKSKIAATCRLDIYNDERFHASCSLFTFKIFNLSAEYSKEDKLTICTNYEVYRNEWDKLQSIDPHKYCALFLCVIYNGSFKESLFDIHNVHYNKNQEVLNNIFDICGINQGTSLRKMKKVLDQIIGTYLRKTKKEYTVIHDRMFDFMCCYFGNTDILVSSVLRYACIAVVSARTQLESINEQASKYAIIISTKYEQTYFARIKNDLQDGHLNQWFNNKQMKFVKYRASFIKALKSIDNDYLTNHQFVKNNIIDSCYRGYDDMVKYFVSQHVDLNKGYHYDTPLTVACLTQNSKIVQFLIDKGCDVNQVDGIGETYLIVACNSGNEKIIQLLIDKGGGSLGETLLIASCKSGNETIVQLLVDKGCDVNQVDGLRNTPLITACKSENEKIVQLLIDKGCDVNQEGIWSETPLIAACKSGNEKIVQLLVDKGCDVNQVARRKDTPLIAACHCGNEKIVQLLVDKGCDVNQKDGWSNTPLITACESGNEKIVQLLIDKGGDVNQVNGNQETPLIAACNSRNEKIVKLLIESGSDVFQVDSKRGTPLIAACHSGNEKTVQLLIYKGCDVNQVDGKKRTPLTAACRSKNEKIVQLLIDKGCDVNQVASERETPLIAACHSGNEKIVQLLIDKGCDVNQSNGVKKTALAVACKKENEHITHFLIDKEVRDNQINGTGQTPLTVACKIGNEKIAQLLIDKGGDVNQINGRKETPLTCACDSKNEKMVQFLVNKGSDVNQVDGKVRTPLTVACNSRHEKLVQFLIEKGGDVNQSKGMTQTPLTAACNSINENVVELLLDAGGEVNKVDGQGKTPLTAVSMFGNNKISELLIDKGADVNQIDDNFETPLTAACKWGKEKTLRFLIGNGCDVNQVDGSKETPLTAACFLGNESIVQFLMDKGCDVNEIDGNGQTPLTVSCNGETRKQ